VNCLENFFSGFVMVTNYGRRTSAYLKQSIEAVNINPELLPLKGSAYAKRLSNEYLRRASTGRH
jgi:hypothetical protein